MIPEAVDSESRLGAAYQGYGRCHFRLWAPAVERAEVHVVDPGERIVAMEPGMRGYYEVTLDGLWPGARYYYRLDGERDRPDPASRFQPEDVHGPSSVVAPEFGWRDSGWSGLPIERFVFYELHVGTFSPEGTFEAVIPWLDELSGLGITAIELMPVAQFPGSRNWGYDGVYLFAPQNSYGGPAGLKRLVDACHRRGLAAVLDVVYNHLGPEGNYLRQFGPYFTDSLSNTVGRRDQFRGPGQRRSAAFLPGKRAVLARRVPLRRVCAWMPCMPSTTIRRSPFLGRAWPSGRAKRRDAWSVPCM